LGWFAGEIALKTKLVGPIEGQHRFEDKDEEIGSINLHEVLVAESVPLRSNCPLMAPNC
jgi:hypothetical protein